MRQAVSHARSSRQRYRGFVDDYRHQRLDEEAGAPANRKPADVPAASDEKSVEPAIARAILASPQILILDEATSNLDTESEQLNQASMATLLAGRTTFVIAHRLSTIRRADVILLMEDGRVIERGAHEQLMDARGAYYAMVRRQMESTAHAAETELTY